MVENFEALSFGVLSNFYDCPTVEVITIGNDSLHQAFRSESEDWRWDFHLVEIN